MSTQHTKSNCCQATIRLYGERRRQCSKCLRTWTINPHKRGRNCKRINKRLLKRIVFESQLVRHQKSSFKQISVSGIYKRLEKALRHESAQEVRLPKLSGAYILLGDGIRYFFKEEEWVLYIFLLKPRRRNYAYLLTPRIIRGKETHKNWKEAIHSIPKETRKRIFGFVSDNFRASRRIAREQNWLHQLCHFHLISEMQKRLGKNKRVLVGLNIREEIYQTVRGILVLKEEKLLPSKILKLKILSQQKDCPRKFKMIVHEFLRNIHHYRLYLSYPTLTIPRTTSAVESVVNLLRKRTAKLKSPKAVQAWSTIFLRFHKKIVCNGQSKKKIQQN